MNVIFEACSAIKDVATLTVPWAFSIYQKIPEVLLEFSIGLKNVFHLTQVQSIRSQAALPGSIVGRFCGPKLKKWPRIAWNW